MSVRRTLVLVALVAIGVAGVLLVHAPVVPVPREQVHGPRVVKVPAAAITAVEIALADGRARLVRTGTGWEVEGMPANEHLAAAVNDLVGLLVGLRAVDRFPDARDEPFGLDAPIGRVTVETPRRRVELALGHFNTSRSAVYARRDGQPRVLLIGSYLLEAMDRVFYRLHLERDGHAAAWPAHRPEIG
jgi:hypothetical protein